VVTDVSNGTKKRITATVDLASNTPQTIVVAMPEQEAPPEAQPATQSPPMYYMYCAVPPPAVVQCVPIRPVLGRCWFRHH
jgi:hypothetical protein